MSRGHAQSSRLAKSAKPATGGPVRGDRCMLLNSNGTPAGLSLVFQGMADEASVHYGRGLFTCDAGERYYLSLESVYFPRVVDEAAEEREAAEQLAADERRRYRSRSRVTAEQRARSKRTAAQLRTIFALGKNLGFGIEELRDMTPLHSLSKLTVREAAQLIDRLQRNRPPGASA